MARETRLHISNALYYVGLHSNYGQLLFHDKRDGLHLYDLLIEGQAKFGYEVFGFCFMDNHIHLALYISNQPLSKIIHNLTFRYTRWFNRRHNRHGHLFIGRYKATVVQCEKYLPDLIRYIHLTPVRLGVTNKPEDYLWSSHRVYLGKEKLDWINTNVLLSQFDDSYANSLEKYQQYIAAGMEHGRPKDLVAEKFTRRIFGDEEFVAKALAEADQPVPSRKTSLDELFSFIYHHFRLTEKELASLGKQRTTSIARGALACLVKYCPHISFTDLAKRVGRDATTLSAHATRIEQQCKKDKELSEFISNIKARIYSTSRSI